MLLQLPPQQSCPLPRGATVQETKMEPSVGEKIPLDVRARTEDVTEGKMEPKQGALELSSVGTGPEAPGQHCLSSREMKRTDAEGCPLVDGSSDLEETTSSLNALLLG